MRSSGDSSRSVSENTDLGSSAQVRANDAAAVAGIAAPCAALQGQSVQCEGCGPFSGAPAGSPPACFRPVALQISEALAGTDGLALARTGQTALSAIPESAIHAATERR